MIKIIILSITFLINSLAFKIDTKEQSQRIRLESGKKNNDRIFSLSKTETINASINQVIASILIYDKKCNPNFASKRIFTNKLQKCKHFNKDLIETKIHTLMDKEDDKFLVLERRVYNRNIYSNVDMVTVKKQKDNTIQINQRTLSDDEAKRYIDNPIKKVSVFKSTKAFYSLKKINENTTKIDYTYSMITDHWLLNKSVVTSKVFSSMIEGTKLLFNSIHKEVQPTTREVATAN